MTKRQEYIALALICAWLLLMLVATTLMLTSQVKPPTISTPESRPQFGSYPPDCGHLYDVDKHREWADCMGVGYISLNVRSQMKRNDT